MPVVDLYAAAAASAVGWASTGNRVAAVGAVLTCNVATILLPAFVRRGRRRVAVEALRSRGS